MAERLSQQLVFENLKLRLLSALIDDNKTDKLIDFAYTNLVLLNEKEQYLQKQLGKGVSKSYNKLSENNISKNKVKGRIKDLKSEKEKIELELINLVGEVPYKIDLPP